MRRILQIFRNQNLVSNYQSLSPPKEKTMSENNPQSLPLPDQLMQMIFGFSLSRSISVAAQFGIADHLTDGAKTADELAQKIGLHARSLYRMLRALASVGIFSEDAEKRFSLTPLAEMLRSDHPQSLRAFAHMMAGEVTFKTWQGLAYGVQTGERAFDHLFGAPAFDWYQQNAEEGKIFNDAMTSMSLGSGGAVVASYDFSGINKIVDIGGGHGYLLAAILGKYPSMQGVLFDLPYVMEDAKKILAANGIVDRCEIATGSFFETAPAGADAYIMKHIIHDWSDEECIKILSHCRAGMNEGGKVLVAEMVLPEGNAPAVSKFLDLQMLLVLPGCERTATEYRALFAKAGLEVTRIIPTPSPYSVIEGVRR